MRIAVLADFKLDSLRNIQVVARKLCKGLIANGHDVLPLSYRDSMLRNSPLPSKRIARIITKRRTDDFCRRIMADYQPDLVVLMAFRNLDFHTIELLRHALPQSKFIAWYEDPLDGVTPEIMQIFQQLDWLAATGAGPKLARIAKDCGIRGAFMPNPCDPDIENDFDVPNDYQCNILFTGKLGHKKCGTDATRAQLIHELVDKFGMTVLGALGNKPVAGREYYRRIRGAKIALSINASNDIRMYHSDRLINCVSCGAFVLAKTVPDSHLLFEDKKHLCYFNSIEQCCELVEYYLTHDQQRNTIARQGMEQAHKMFDCRGIAKDLVSLVTDGHYDKPWREIV